MDPEIAELKKLVEKNTAMTQETNRIVHGMRRSQRVHTALSWLWWVAIFVLSAGAYYYYLQPYVDKLQQTYVQIQAGGQQAQQWEKQAQEFFQKFLPQATTTHQ